ncbi:MAG: tetratricopeptide repeat protein [Saprospiraceae bacterium]|nr:tetratricopeptide repeat protein [Saprospiraceae bacterium]
MKYSTLFCLFLIFGLNTLLAQSEAQADELMAQGELDAANTIYETLLKQASNAPEQALGLALKLANNYQQAQDYEKAVALLSKETAHWKSSTTADSLLGLAFHTLGICYFNLKDFPKAISHYEQAIKFRQRFSADYHIDMLKSMRNIGNAHLEMLNFQEAGKYYQK